MFKNKIQLFLEKWYFKIPVFVIGALLILFLLFLLTGFTYTKVYKNKIYPGVSVGEYNIGSMTQSELQDFIETLNDRLFKEGLDFNVLKDREMQELRVNTILISEENTLELVKLDSSKLSEQSFGIARDGDWFFNIYEPLFLLFSKKEIKAPVMIENYDFKEILNSYLSNFIDEPKNANVSVKDPYALEYELTPEKSGTYFDYNYILENIKTNLSLLSFRPIEIAPIKAEPDILLSDLGGLVDSLEEFLSYGTVGLNYVDPQTSIKYEWFLIKDDYAPWLQAKRDEDGLVVFGLDADEAQKYLKDLSYKIYRNPQDAKFEMEDGKVKKFQANSAGLKLDIEESFVSLEKAIKERNYKPDKTTQTVALSVEVIEPKIKMSDVNDLGIHGIVGFGYSTFRDSHNNRIKNIANAVDHLNGTLIKPGEEFSTNKYAGPYTLENGYLPEEVIKGTEIKKEVGGGMCQIGTTMFRTAMNSAMPIVERQNHSLVVGYYADPVNGNPGTDATLYDPYLDLKFLNDTENYLLLQTEIDYDKQELKFTLWGMSGGRKGWFTHPIVERWISPGEEQKIETLDLEPGTEKCQSAFVGAVTTFSYYRLIPGEEKIEREFESYYRPLPRICLVGVEELTPVCEDDNCDNNEQPAEDNTNTESTGPIEGVEVLE